jgi:hypothetical protein
MPGAYSQILCRVVFSTKHREPWIKLDFAEPDAQFLRPSGTDLRCETVFHGLRFARLTAGCAPPVATFRGPAGAEEPSRGNV